MPDPIIAMFERAGAYLRGHFLLTSGRHSDVYFEKFALLAHPEVLEPLLKQVADRHRNDRIATVVGPTLGGAIIAFELARQLGCRAVYAEADGNRRVLRRGFSLDTGERVLICDDILTTGRSVREVITMTESYKAEIVGVSLLLDRAGGDVTFDYPTASLASINAVSYEPADCPLCHQGVELTQRGSRQMTQ
jgi:orotate phosphoribosyltransferase